MDLTRLAVDAGAFINRAVQYTEESLGQAERTELGGSLDDLLAQAETTKTWTDQILAQTEVLLQPNPGARIEDLLYERLDWNVPPRPRPHEVLGETMTQAGLELAPNTPYGAALQKCGEAQKQMGGSERMFIQSTAIHFLSPLRRYTEGEYRDIQNERRMLVNKRLDLDIAKTRVRKAHEAERQARDLDASPAPLGEDYVGYASYMFSFLRVKWLKMWAQEISQAEMELRICQSVFDRQSEVTRRLVEGIGNTHANHLSSLIDLVEAQACYYTQAHLITQELQRQMASLPAVHCSNIWQSTPTQTLATSHGDSHPIATSQPASRAVVEVTDLLLECSQSTETDQVTSQDQVTSKDQVTSQDQVTSLEDQTANPPSSTGAGTPQSSMTKSSTNQTNNHSSTANQSSTVKLASNQAL